MACLFFSTYKKSRFAFLHLFILFFSSSFFAQTAEHSTIARLEVSYKEPDITMMDTLKLVRAQSVITLKSDVNVTTIHLKIIKELDNSVIYQVDQLVNSSTITNPEGIILFKREGNVIYINSPSMMPLNLYQYYITTEDAQGQLSEPFVESH